MTNAASTSNPSVRVKAYPNFVTVKLSGKSQYNLWRIQMECLLKSQHMVDFIKDADNGKGKGKVGDMAMEASDSLVKGWILGSLSEEAARKAVNHLIHMQKKTDFTAKDLWDELQRSYGPSLREQAAETKLTTRQAESKDEPTVVIKKAKYTFIETWLKGNTFVMNQLEEDSLNPWDKLTTNGNTVLHEAVASSTKNHEILKNLLEMTPTDKLNETNSYGSSLLHVAAIGGNTEAVHMLVERNPELLLAKDNEGHIPLALSVSNMHTKTSKCLFEHMKGKGYGSYFSGQSGEEIVVLAITCQDFRLANWIINDYPDAILPNSEAVLTALAQNFPRELNSRETRRGLWVMISVFYGFLNVLDTFQIHKDATDLLSDVCSVILIKRNPSTHHRYYTTSIFEATKRNASTFIRCMMRQFPNAIWSTNEDGHNFIQYSVINRSEKIYSLLYEMNEHKNIYKTIKDSSGNNLSHLVARLAPTNKLNQTLWAALKIQRELQWFKEVERFVCPLNRIQRNSDDETPEMVLTREHKDLVIEGEQWIKKTAESYTINAALIITIVFAAAITVPGGNNQESGTPIFINNSALAIFAISDAISLFTSVTSLLTFLSILTARFAEQDFLFRLPTKLIIGLTMLVISATTMIIAFGATMFLVFGQGDSLILVALVALSCIPIMSFVTMQFPLIIGLVRATYGPSIFVNV